MKSNNLKMKLPHIMDDLEIYQKALKRIARVNCVESGPDPLMDDEVEEE